MVEDEGTEKVETGRSIPEWAWMVLLAILIFDVWWRGHTFGPTVKARYDLKLWPVVEGDSEPLDCDEAAYGYIGREIDQGAVMYRDLTENKPPLGYWLYALGIRMGRPDELTVRLLSIPMVLVTIVLRLVARTAALRAVGGLPVRVPGGSSKHRPVSLWKRLQPRACDEPLRHRLPGGDGRGLGSEGSSRAGSAGSRWPGPWWGPRAW